MKLNAAGNAVEYATTVGGVNEDQVTGVAVDANGHAYVAGFTKSLDFPMVPSTNAVDAVFGGITDAFVARISPGDATLSVSQPLAGQVQISWSTGLPGYKLFTTGAVPTSTNWTEVLLPVEVVGGENRVTLTNVTGEAFFQLRR
jgi:hypothetical protein